MRNLLKKSNLVFESLPAKVQQEHIEWLLDKISAIPENNVVETVSQFIERRRSIGKGLTARPGPFSYSVTPYLREIVDNQSDMSPILETYVIKSTQLGFTVGVLESHLLYCIAHSIGPLLYVGSDQETAEMQFEKRVDEGIESCGLQDKIKPNVTKKKGKGTGDTVQSKSYGGTFARAIGSNSESKAATFPSRVLHLDEMDKYAVRLTKNGVDAGDIVMKLIRRQDSYDKLKKTIGGSTPKSIEVSRIGPLVEQGDKRHYHVRCPKCDFQQPLIFKQLKWDKNEKGEPDIQYIQIDGVDIVKKDPVWYECIECGHKIKQKDKYDLLQEKGYGGTAEWLPSKKPDRPFVRSYVISGLYGFRTFLDIVLEFVRVKDDPFLFPEFVTDTLGEVWSESATKPSEHTLMQLAQEFEQWPRGTIKNDVLLLTMGVDVQQDRLEAMLMGHSRNRQMYAIDYFTFPGDPSVLEDTCWKQLSEKINMKYVRDDGQQIYVVIAFVDSQYLSDTVDMYCDSHPYNPMSIAGVYPCQSRETLDKTVKQFKSNIKTPVIGLNDQFLKRTLYNILRKRPSAPGRFPNYYLHNSYEYGPNYYAQLTSEEIVQIKVKNVNKGFKILNTKQKRNEVLDCAKLNLAAFQYAMDKYYYLTNETLKLQKRKLLQEDISAFFDFVESELYT